MPQPHPIQQGRGREDPACAAPGISLSVAALFDLRFLTYMEVDGLSTACLPLPLKGWHPLLDFPYPDLSRVVERRGQGTWTTPEGLLRGRRGTSQG